MEATALSIADEAKRLLEQSSMARKGRWQLLTDDVREERDEVTGEQWYYIPIVFPEGSPDDDDSYRELSDVEDRIHKDHANERLRVLFVPAI